MALDGIFLRHIKNEIENEALGARVSQIYRAFEISSNGKYHK